MVDAVMLARFGFWAVAVLPLVFLGLLVVWPLLAMLRYENAAPLWANMIADDYYQWRLVWTTIQAGLSVLLTLLFGVPAGWVLARLDFRGRRLLLRLLMLPFVMPTLVAAIGILALFGQQGLLLRGWQDTPYLLLYGNVFFNLPVMLRASYQGFLQVPAHRLAAAQTLGAGVWRRFYYVELPVLMPWLAGAGCLVFLYCFSGFGLALLLGGQRYATVEVEIYQLIAYELDMARAAVLVWLVLGATAMAGAVYALLSRYSHVANVQAKIPEPPCGVGQKCLLIMVLAGLAWFCALPLVAVLVRAFGAGDSWQVLWDSETWAALYNTLRFTAMAAVCAAILGVSQAALARHITAARGLTFLPFMVSPICLAFGTLLVYPHYSASLGLLVGLYALLAYPFVTKDVLAAWDALPSSYTAIARVCGATPFQTMRMVILPLLLPALRRGLTLAVATGIGEFAATLLLSRPEWTTLTTLIYRYLGRPGMENYDKAAVLTVVLMMLATGVFICLDGKESTN